MKIAIASILFFILSTNVFAANTSRVGFLSFFQSQLPRNFCNTGSGIRDCYSLTENVCMKIATEAVKSCIDQVKDKIPDPVTGKDDGKKWGTIIGQCAGGKVVAEAAKLAPPASTSQERTLCLKSHMPK